MIKKYFLGNETITMDSGILLLHHGEMNDHGEAMILYGINVLFLFFAGPGKFSLDAKLKTSSATL